MKLTDYQDDVAVAERESAAAYDEWRAAHRRFFDADMRLLHARLNLADAERELARPSDTERKA